MANEIQIVTSVPITNKYGETCSTEWKTVFYCPCAEHYPKSSQGVTGQIVETENGELVKTYEIVFIETCACKCYDICDTDIQVGMYAYLSNKFWKIISVQVYDDCGCFTIKLILNRLEPRETHRKMVECVKCFGGKC